MAEVKLSRGDLKDPKGCDGSPIGSGCYGVVYHKILKPPVSSKTYSIVHIIGRCS